MPDLIVLAIGGSSLIRDEQHRTGPDQWVLARETCRHIAEIIQAGHRVVVTHGNGPQVGFIIRRSELARHELHPVPLDSCDADTQGAIGYMIQQSLENEFLRRGVRKSAVALVTQVEVDADSPAFANPTKPIGVFMDEATARSRAAQEGWVIKEDAGRGWRKVVPPPKPQKIPNMDLIREVLKVRDVVVAGGGGGIPVEEPLVGVELREGILEAAEAEPGHAGEVPRLRLSGVGGHAGERVALRLGEAAERQLALGHDQLAGVVARRLPQRRGRALGGAVPLLRHEQALSLLEALDRRGVAPQRRGLVQVALAAACRLRARRGQLADAPLRGAVALLAHGVRGEHLLEGVRLLPLELAQHVHQLREPGGVVPGADQVLKAERVGLSLVVRIEQNAPPRDVVIEWNAVPGSDGESVRTLVTPDGWKLTLSTRGRHELRNLRDDPIETSNLVKQNPAQTRHLAGRIAAWQRATGDTCPVTADVSRAS